MLAKVQAGGEQATLTVADGIQVDLTQDKGEVYFEVQPDEK